MKYESHVSYHSKNILNVKAFKYSSMLKFKVKSSKLKVPMDRPYHKEHTYEKKENLITYQPKDMANVNVF
jgi:hypothetical protein